MTAWRWWNVAAGIVGAFGAASGAWAHRLSLAGINLALVVINVVLAARRGDPAAPRGPRLVIDIQTGPHRD